MTKEKKTSRTIKESKIDGKVTKEEVKVAVKAVEEPNIVVKVVDLQEIPEEPTPKEADNLAEWQKKVEADLNAMAERCYEKRYLQINSHKPEFVDLKKETK